MTVKIDRYQAKHYNYCQTVEIWDKQTNSKIIEIKGVKKELAKHLEDACLKTLNEYSDYE